MSGQNTASCKVEFRRGSRESPDLDGVPGRLVGRRYPAADMSTAQSFLFLLILLGAAATSLRLVSRRTPTVPYPVLLALGGILIGLVPGLRLPPIGPDLILLAFVPGLVFEASLSLDLEELWRRVVPITLLATFGVLFTVALIGALAHFALGLDWANGFLLGSIVAATDPIAVVNLLRQLGAPRGLEAILDGESLFNDGTGVAVFAAVLGTILTGHPSFVDAGTRLLYVTIAGIVIGVAAGAVAVVGLRRVQDAELEILITLVLAYGSYLAADLVHGSGVVSVVSAGLVVARYGSRTGRLKGTQLHGFWSLLAFVLNAVLFLIVGIALPTHRLLDIAGLALGAYLIMFAARVLPGPLFAPLVLLPGPAPGPAVAVAGFGGRRGLGPRLSRQLRQRSGQPGGERHEGDDRAGHPRRQTPEVK